MTRHHCSTQDRHGFGMVLTWFRHNLDTKYYTEISVFQKAVLCTVWGTSIWSQIYDLLDVSFSTACWTAHIIIALPKKDWLDEYTVVSATNAWEVSLSYVDFDAESTGVVFLARGSTVLTGQSVWNEAKQHLHIYTFYVISEYSGTVVTCVCTHQS